MNEMDLGSKRAAGKKNQPKIILKKKKCGWNFDLVPSIDFNSYSALLR
jgi:hypothetical protein